MIALVLTAVAAVSLLYMFLLRRDEKRLAYVYNVPGSLYWFKRILYHLQHLVKRETCEDSLQSLTQSEHVAGADNFSFKDYMLQDPAQGKRYFSVERVQELNPDSKHACDSVYFAGTDKNGYHITCGVARRSGCKAEVWLSLSVPGYGVLQHPAHPDTVAHNTSTMSEEVFTAGGLTCEVVAPMKIWRVSFCGKLRKANTNESGENGEHFVETSFSFIWKAFSQPFNCNKDCSLSLKSENVAREPWCESFLQNLERQELETQHYQQWGELRGRLTVEGEEEKHVYLQTVRERFFGNKDWASYHRYVKHFIYLESGMCIQLGVVSEPVLLSHAKMGYVSFPNGDLTPVSQLNLNLWEFAEESSDLPMSWSFSFVAGGKTYTVNATLKGFPSQWYTGYNRCGKILEVATEFKVNSVLGHGVTEFLYRGPGCPDTDGVEAEDIELVLEASAELVRRKEREITLPFSDLACTSSALVGGKGAQLAQLTQIEDQVSASVPPGFCLTLYSFELQLLANVSIQEAITAIEQSAVTAPASLGTVCEEAVQQIKAAEVCADVRAAILESLQSVDSSEGGADFHTAHFAVRSSAAGEDGTEASSAGQMETILGVVGVEKIMKAVRQCWSSVYAHQAVEYRRQHGQPIGVSVGVVIQQMVPADAAGVMFTADPLSGSSSVVVVNANFGLGESVVSGSSDPDTIRINRHPDAPHNTSRLSLGVVHVGEKKTRIVESGYGGIKEEAVSEAESVCLNEEIILKLAALGIKLEKRFGSPRDVEWAVVGAEIFMLQCRPITVSEAETQEDLLHEFDSPMTCNYQWMTTSNISEMIPGALTPLSLSTFSTSIEYSLQTLLYHVGARQRPLHLSKCLPRVCNHLFIALIDVGSIVSHAMMARKDIMEISLLGSHLPEMTHEQLRDYAGSSSPLRRFVNFVNMMRMWSKASAECSRWEKQIPTYKIGETAKTATDLYRCINKQLADYEMVWVWTLINSGRSGNMATVLMSIVGGDASCWTTEHYGDMALLLSQCNDVYSAEVPHAIKNIAQAIAETGEENVEQFLSTPDENCMDFLSKNPDILKKVQSFLSRHGHRCLREAELREKSWRSAPEKFISVVKLMLKTKAYEKSERDHVSIPELLEKMKTKLPFHKKQILKYLLPKAWQAVGAREWGKSLAVQMHEVFKLAYQRLGTLLHAEGRLPDPDLLYFLSHQEIGTLIDTRSARLVIKAQKRRKLLNKQMSLKFDQMNKTRPVPIDVSLSNPSTANVECLSGMPVSQGQITGPARVVHSLDGASAIKAGDILVVKSTDVGWSPYFPLIGGLVTELGGLISHGAVVAREYGIPCVVNVSKATSIIASGETLELDGRAGTVKRLEAKYDSNINSDGNTESHINTDTQAIQEAAQ